MDQSRQADLKRLDTRLADPTLTGNRRDQAAQAKSKIIAQSRDKKLSALRTQLIRATQANDTAAVKTITARIKAHTKEIFEDYE